MKTSQSFYLKSAKILVAEPALTVALMYPAEYLPDRRGRRPLKDENEMLCCLNMRRVHYLAFNINNYILKIIENSKC